MTLAPLLDASPVIQIHAAVAIGAFLLGAVQLTAPKGTLSHRSAGWVWVVLMATIAISSFWISGGGVRLVGRWGPIHLLSIFSLVMLPWAVLSARRHDVRRHKTIMIGMFIGALVVAGLFTLAPGRIMHAALFGG